MAIPVIMPKQGQSVETCVITQWFKKPGDKVNEGDILFGYETDKASFEEEAKTSGTLLAVFYEEGDEVPVLQNMAVIGEEGEDVESFRAGDNKDEPASETEQVKEEVQQEGAAVKRAEHKEEVAPEISGEPVTETTGRVAISPRAKHKAGSHGLEYRNIKGTGPGGRIIEKDIDEAAKKSSSYTVLAGEMASKKEVAGMKTGTGIGGRITDEDLKKAPVSAGEDSTLKKLSNIRKIIAGNMQASLANSAQLTHHMSADARKLLDYRKKFKAAHAGGNSENITINDMVCFAVIKALKRHPDMNSHFLDDSIRSFNNVHLGFAVDTERGLMVPSLRNADDLNIQGLSRNIKELAEKCRKGAVDPELLSSQAASFTISNLGAYGVEMFTPVLNLPQSGILGVCAITQRPAELGGGVIGFVPYIGLSLTYDHRSVDGAPASAFLKEVKEEIENLEFDI